MHIGRKGSVLVLVLPYFLFYVQIWTDCTETPLSQFGEVIAPDIKDRSLKAERFVTFYLHCKLRDAI